MRLPLSDWDIVAFCSNLISVIRLRNLVISVRFLLEESGFLCKLPSVILHEVRGETDSIFSTKISPVEIEKLSESMPRITVHTTPDKHVMLQLVHVLLLLL